MRKNGSSGSASVKKLMNEAKIPAELRDCHVVVACGDKVLAVEGIGVNYDFAAGPGGSALKIEIKRRSFS
jgi:tRNA(Ile)-lysidine synthetase-like protein